MQNTPAFSRIEVTPGRSLHYTLEGPEAAPFVLYDAGAFGIYADGWWVKEALKASFRVCLYDRAGMGASDPVPEGTSPSPDFHVADMQRLVRALGHSGPITLIGHSMAGLRLHSFANLYPEDLHGMVFVDALSPRIRQDRLSKFAQEQFGNMLKVGAYGARLGLAERVANLAPNNFKLEGRMREDKVWSYGARYHHVGARNEVLAVDINADYLNPEAITRFPIAIFASTYINGMTQADADEARTHTGYGWFGQFPREDHVSILIGVYADAIASRVKEINDLPTGITGKLASL